MTKCYYSNIYKSRGIVSFIISFLIAIYFLFILPEATLWYEYLILSIIIIFLLYLGILTYLVYSSRSYKIQEGELIVQDFYKRVVTYPMDKIAEISVCDIHHEKYGLYEKVIRIAIDSEKNGPTNPKCSRHLISTLEHWRGLRYSFIHYKKIILIEYTDERLAYIYQAYKREIKDYRTKAWK